MTSMSSDPIKLAVLVSGSGTTLQNLIDEITAKRLDARIVTVIGSREGLKGIERARAANLPVHVVNPKASESCAAFSREVFAICRDAEADLVVFAGWLCLLELPGDFIGKVMNIHPALLPSFGGKGMYGSRVHQAVLDHGCKISGCTVHVVDSTYDTGPIIIQRPCQVKDDDTPATLAARVFAEEKVAYPEAIRLFHEGKLRIEGRRVRIQD
jgi:phosphoribosylglycinamide formyltransferase-1